MDISKIEEAHGHLLLNEGMVEVGLSLETATVKWLLEHAHPPHFTVAELISALLENIRRGESTSDYVDGSVLQ